MNLERPHDAIVLDCGLIGERQPVLEACEEIPAIGRARVPTQMREHTHNLGSLLYAQVVADRRGGHAGPPSPPPLFQVALAPGAALLEPLPMRQKTAKLGLGGRTAIAHQITCLSPDLDRHM